MGRAYCGEELRQVGAIGGAALSHPIRPYETSVTALDKDSRQAPEGLLSCA